MSVYIPVANGAAGRADRVQWPRGGERRGKPREQPRKQRRAAQRSETPAPTALPRAGHLSWRARGRRLTKDLGVWVWHVTAGAGHVMCT